MKRLTTAIGVLLLALCVSGSLTSCSNSCDGVKKDLETARTQMDEEFSRAVAVYESSPVYEGYFDPDVRMVPYVDSNGETKERISNGPILTEFYTMKKVWLTIQVNNPKCFDARTVADAQIELEKY